MLEYLIIILIGTFALGLAVWLMTRAVADGAVVARLGFVPQTDVHLAVIPVDAALETTPTVTEATLLAVPDGANFQIELLSIGFWCHTLPVDAGVNVEVDIERVDASAANAVADLATDFNLQTATVLVYNEVWRGRLILDAGDAVNAEFDVATPTTASEGAVLIVEYRYAPVAAQ